MEGNSIGRYSEFAVSRRTSLFEVCTSKDASFWLDTNLLVKFVAQLAVCLQRCFIRIEFHSVVVYRETLPIECCLSNDKFELCVWSHRSNALFP